MSKAVENLRAAQKRAMAGRPKVGGFAYLAETLRRAGVIRNVWSNAQDGRCQPRRAILLQRTAITPLTSCLSPGVHFMPRLNNGLC
jgi:hypothetical protein